MSIAVASHRLSTSHHACRFIRLVSAARPSIARIQSTPRMAMSTNSGIPWQRISLSNKERLYPLLTTYVEQPSAAESVTELVMDCSYWDNLWPRKDLPDDSKQEAVYEEAHEPVHEYVRSLGLDAQVTKDILHFLRLWQNPHDQDLGAACRQINGFAAAAAVVLLSLCRNISTLYLAMPQYAGVNPILDDYFLKNNYGLLKTPSLQNLKRVQVLPGDSLHMEPDYAQLEFLRVFQYFHRLPAIEDISLDSMQHYQTYHNLFVPRTGNMKSLSVEHSDMDVSLLDLLISIPKVLVELKVSIGGKLFMEGGSPRIIPQTVGRSLAHHKDTLKRLDLDLDQCISEYVCKEMAPSYVPIDEVAGDEAPDEDDIEQFGRDYYKIDQEARLMVPQSTRDFIAKQDYDWTIGSLSDFTSLTHLSISVHALLGPPTSYGDRLARKPPFRFIDALPPDLEYLCLYGYKKGENIDIDDHIEEFVTHREVRFPRLKEVRGVEEEVPGVAQLFDDDECSILPSPGTDGEEEDDVGRFWKTPQLPDGWRSVPNSSR